MIKINFDNEDITHNIFEFLRITMPSYEKQNNIFINIILEENYLVDIKSEEINISFYVEKVNDKRDQKFKFKQEFYKNFYNYFEYKDNWGILTGVKPVKLVLKLLQGKSESEVKKLLKDYYFLTESAIELCINIAKIESGYIYPLDEKRYDLYIHIPFCPTKCSYCSFLTLKNTEEVTKKYTEVLIEELKASANLIKENPRSIYIGGGTPTAINIKDLEKIIKSVNDNYGSSQEFTVECGRPDTINSEMLYMLKENNVNRISINPQSMNDSTLKLIGRSHNVENIIDTYNLARKVGFKSINMDLILGLPGENKKQVSETLNEVFKMDPENITIHTLALKNGSNLFNKNYNNISDIDSIIEYTKKETLKHNYYPYYMYRQKRMTGNGENIGYCKEGFESIYNIIMMEEKESVIGFGMCSTSKFFYVKNNKLEKVMQYRNINDYLNKCSEIIEKKNKKIKNFNF